MEKFRIGENAGRIWHVLNGVEDVTIRDLSHILSLSETDVALALGWLARENNVYISKKQETYFISNGSKSSLFF